MPSMSWFFAPIYRTPNWMNFCSHPRSRWICLALEERYMSVWRCNHVQPLAMGHPKQLKDEHLSIWIFWRCFSMDVWRFWQCEKTFISATPKNDLWSVSSGYIRRLISDPQHFPVSFGASQVLGNEWSFGMQVPGVADRCRQSPQLDRLVPINLPSGKLT